MSKYIIVFLIATVFSMLLVPLSKLLAKRIGAIDIPGERKIHKKPKPRLGGLAISSSFLITLLITFVIPGYSEYVFKFLGVNVRELLLGILILICIAVYDDVKNLKPAIKFIFQFAVGLLVYLDSSSGGFASRFYQMFLPDREHLHHKILQKGFTHKNTVLVLYGIAIVFGLLAFSNVALKNSHSGLFLFAVVLASIIGINRLGYREVQFLKSGAMLPLFENTRVDKRIFQVFIDILLVSLTYYLAFWAV